MRILGIDPGLRTTGFGVLDAAGGQLAYVASGVIQTADAPQGSLPARLKLLYDGIGEICRRYAPDVAVVEIVFVNVNPQATLLLGQARGACVTALVAQNLPVTEYTALQMKQTVAGHGRAAKAQVQEMVRRLLALPAAPPARRRRCARPGHHPRPRQPLPCPPASRQRPNAPHRQHVPPALRACWLSGHEEQKRAVRAGQQGANRKRVLRPNGCPARICNAQERANPRFSRLQTV